MASFLANVRRILTGSKAPRSYGRSIDTNFSIFQGRSFGQRLHFKSRILTLILTYDLEGDRVLIHGKNPILSKPLKRSHKSPTPRGHIEHDDIIGQSARDVIRANKGKGPVAQFRILRAQF